MKYDHLEEAPYPTPAGVIYRAGKRVGGAICPRCPKYIAVTSQVMRLYRPEEPDSLDGRTDRTTGEYYHWDGRSVGMKPRWFVHAYCWDKKR